MIRVSSKSTGDRNSSISEWFSVIWWAQLYQRQLFWLLTIPWQLFFFQNSHSLWVFTHYSDSFPLNVLHEKLYDGRTILKIYFTIPYPLILFQSWNSEWNPESFSPNNHYCACFLNVTFADIGRTNENIINVWHEFQGGDLFETV